MKTNHQFVATAYIEEAKELLLETYNFASTSPRGQQNINGVLALLDDIEAVQVEPKPTLANSAKPAVQVEPTWNKKIRDNVDSLLAQAGYAPDSSARHQLSLMNFDSPSVQVEPTLYQFRCAPAWTDLNNWSAWADCSEEQHSDYVRSPLVNDWKYEVRKLYATPQQPDVDSNARLQKENREL